MLTVATAGLETTLKWLETRDVNFGGVLQTDYWL